MTYVEIECFNNLKESVPPAPQRALYTALVYGDLFQRKQQNSAPGAAWI